MQNTQTQTSVLYKKRALDSGGIRITLESSSKRGNINVTLLERTP